MDEKRKGEVSWTLMKRYLKKEVSFRDIADTKRNIGNVSKETGVPQGELLEYMEIILREVFQELLKPLTFEGSIEATKD